MQSQFRGGRVASALRAEPALILLSGVPATGKSTFGRWLECERGFDHVDVENGGFDRLGLSLAWSAVCQLPPPQVSPFIAALRGLRRPIALDWGFPPPWLPLVRALHDAGVTAWWFDGDRQAARAVFIRRATVQVEALDLQMRHIEAYQALFDDFYAGRVVQAIHPDGSFTPPERIFDTIFADGSLP
jgi:hypothetical protein